MEPKIPVFSIAASVTPAIDVYSFGMCALEMAALEIQGNGDSGTLVTDEHIHKTIESLDDAQQKDFIFKCLHREPSKRPSARELLFHPLLFEVHSLKLLAAHALVNSTGKNLMISLQFIVNMLLIYVTNSTRMLFFSAHQPISLIQYQMKLFSGCMGLML